MKLIFELLYYCLYRMFSTVKRVNERNENLASLFFSVLISTNTIMLTFPIKFLIKKGALDSYLIKLLPFSIIAIIFLFWYYYCDYYFLKKGRYIEVVKIYEKKYNNFQFAFLGIFYAVVSFVSFFFFAKWIGSVGGSVSK